MLMLRRGGAGRNMEPKPCVAKCKLNAEAETRVSSQSRGQGLKSKEGLAPRATEGRAVDRNVADQPV